MLNSIDLNDKNYDELLSEALAQIPLYSNEWTNFNLSDPGITILQNLTAFNILQQENLSQVTEKLRRRLLQLVGYVARENSPATVLVQSPKDNSITLPAHYATQVGSLTFETAAPVTTDIWSIKAIYMGETGNYRDITRLLDAKNGSSADIFGTPPTVGYALFCIIDGEPAPNSQLRFWVKVPDGDHRVPFDPNSSEPSFAETRWQYFTDAGWQDVETVDNTHGFLSDGEISLTLGDASPAMFPETEIFGCALRCILCKHDYDIAPRLQTFSGNLFPMLQKKTSAASFVLPGGGNVTIRSCLAALGNIYVYCRESEGGDYYAYREALPDIIQNGRYYNCIMLEDGVRIEFNQNNFGYGPVYDNDSVLVCCYDNEMLHHRALGPVYGYENQIINLYLVSSLVPNGIAVLAELPAEGDEPACYRLICPNADNPDELCYTVLSEEGQLLIRHPAYDGTYNLFLCDCVTTQGEFGNIRASASLQRLGGYDGTEVDKSLTAPSPGFGGVTFESAEQLRMRFLKDMRQRNTAVTAEDYETLAKSTPGLSIHKVKAVIFPKENLVKLVVKPYTENERPILSPLYIKQLSAHLEGRRMLTTRIDLISPRYVRVDVNLKVFVNPHFEHADEEIKTLLRRCLDYVTTDTPFGSWVRFGEIYGALSSLPCVVRVDFLRLLPEDRANFSSTSSDFKLSDNALCYPGDIRLELHAFTSKGR